MSLDEIAGLARVAEFAQVSGAGAVDQRDMAEWAHYQAAVVQIADAHRAVDPFLHQIDGAIGGAEHQLQMRMAPQQAGQRRRDQPAGDAARTSTLSRPDAWRWLA